MYSFDLPFEQLIVALNKEEKLIEECDVPVKR